MAAPVWRNEAERAFTLPSSDDSWPRRSPWSSARGGDGGVRRGACALHIEGNPDEWGAGELAEQDDLPPAPTGVVARPGNGRVMVFWDPVPDAMYYNLYFLTSKGVQIKYSDLTRPFASEEDFNPIIGVTKEKGNCIEGPSSPYSHDDLANGTCYHYVVTAVTSKGESPDSQEVMAIPDPYLLVMKFGRAGVDDGEFSSPTGIALDKEGSWLHPSYGVRAGRLFSTYHVSWKRRLFTG